MTIEVRAIRRAIREREGELRDDACERLRHAARRYAMAASKARRGALA